jgi:hypothetical protein
LSEVNKRGERGNSLPGVIVMARSLHPRQSLISRTEWGVAVLLLLCDSHRWVIMARARNRRYRITM